MTPRPLIPRRTLFDNPTFFDAKLSPDGCWLSWLAPVDGVLDVWVSPVDQFAEALRSPPRTPQFYPASDCDANG